MRQITSLLRAVAPRRRPAGVSYVIGDAPADISNSATHPCSAQAVQRVEAWAEIVALRLSSAMSQTPPRITPHASPARASSDFTAQVMARLAAPPPEPDPRESRARQMRAHMRRLVGVYLTLVLVGVVALIALAALAPWALVGLVAGIVSLALVAMTFAGAISRLTGGAISGLGVAYVAMLATLSSSLLLIARRVGRGSSRAARRR
jgi:hypothetical protein